MVMTAAAASSAAFLTASLVVGIGNFIATAAGVRDAR